MLVLCKTCPGWNTVTRYIRQAESLIEGEDRGDEKKAYVLDYLKELFAGVKNELLSKLIDLVVAILNTMGWW